MPQRKSNMELLRIFAMCLIVLFHCAYHSGFPDPNSVAAHGNMLVVRIFWFFGELGVNLFILTTGYFQVNGRFKWGKLALLWAQVLFYSLLTACFAWFVLSPTLPIENVILPVTFRNYWFATAYVVVYMLSPYANLLIKSMDKRTFQRFLLTLLVLYSAIPTVLGNLSGNTENFMYYNRMVWLFVMYFTGAYIRLYSLPLVESMREALLCAAGSFALMVISLFALYAVNTVSENLKEVAYFRPPNTVPMVILSVG
ncbi:MAG: acyltransferase family protein, partial [Oscillibacter sp.]|nr:acyltransferase family protein [Oscillibacter sp.]